VDPTTEPIGAFTGPMLYTWATHLESYLVPTPYGYDAVTGAGDGSVEMQAGCASTFQATYTPPQPDRLGPGVGTCHIGLSPKDQTSASPGSSVKVDGHDAYLPSGVYQYLLAERALFTLTVPTITVSISHSTDGSLHVTEADPLMRCSVDDTYPPTVASCPLLVPTGVTLHRKIDTIRGLHQVRVRDQWVSTDGQAHSVSVRYFGQAAGTQPGFRFPGDAQFQLTTAGQQVSNLGTKAGTLLERSDFSAPSTDLAVNTFGITWSRPPSNVSFAPTFKTMYALAYTLSVSPSHPGYLGFAVSEHGSTSAATTLGGQAVADMVSRPTISTPANHATISGHSTTVKGSVTLGANGLPTSVTVNGHAAHLTPVSATKETYSVTFTESLGTHQLNVVAKDSVGNTASRSITVKNVA
jgi:hypothetical protein